GSYPTFRASFGTIGPDDLQKRQGLNILDIGPFKKSKCHQGIVQRLISKSLNVRIDRRGSLLIFWTQGRNKKASKVTDQALSA
ncbi:MAG: hypothetical protein EZS28_050759, partial [Streblomastix strix]